MPLMSFSIPQHIPLLLDGRKVQTTRQPRKKSLKIGDVLYCYYKPRQKKSCKNCINLKCPAPIALTGEGCIFCKEWNNYFGEAIITSISHYVNGLAYESGDWHYILGKQNEKFMESWAKADGFADLQEAHKWFVKSSKNHQWMFNDWDVITFEPRWIRQEITERPKSRSLRACAGKGKKGGMMAEIEGCTSNGLYVPCELCEIQESPGECAELREHTRARVKYRSGAGT